MNCKSRFVGWWFHDWKVVLMYPPQLSDGEGGAWAGHRVEQCGDCGKIKYLGIWAASETLNGKSWSFMRSAYPSEIDEAIKHFS